MSRNPGSALLLAAIIMLAPAASQAATPLPAQIMPLAPQSLLLDIATAGARLVAVGERGHILYSDDNGSSWQQAPVPTNQMLTALHFVDDQHGWAVGHDGLILVSDDGGSTWRIQRDGIAAQRQANLAAREDAHQQIERLEQSILTADPAGREALELELEDAVMDLEDADLALAEDVFTSPLMDIWFLNRNRGWAVGAFGTLLATANGGKNWASQPAALDNPDEFHLNAITGDSQGRVFIAGETGLMYRSVNGGDSWQTLEPFYEGSWFGALYSARHTALLVFGLRGNLYRSDDFGEHWQAVNVDNNMTLAGGSVSEAGQITVVGAVGTVLRSSDGGRSFRHRRLPDRLSLSSGLARENQLVLVGQGGVRTLAEGGNND